MEIGVLGPLEARAGGAVIPLGAAKRRAVLAMLALDANTLVLVDRLIDGLWGEAAPDSARKLIQVYVSGLRKALADAGIRDAIQTEGHGYRLRLEPDALDLRRAQRLVHESVEALEAGRPSSCAHAALELWRGPPLSDLDGLPFADVAIPRLEELRLTAVELAIEEDLARGRHREVLPEIEGLLAQHPLRENLHAQRMLALYRTGRQADALAAFTEARATLVERIGAEPGPELQRLHERLLRQDPALSPPPEPTAIDDRALPPTLEPTSPLLVGRDAELRRLLAAWRAVRAGTAGSVLVVGANGMGKTRLVAELAQHVQRDGGRILHTAAGDPRAVVERAAAATRPGLLFVDDADALERALVMRALTIAADASCGTLVVVAASAHPAPEIAADVAETLVLAPLDGEAVELVAQLYAGLGDPVPVGELLAESGGVPLAVHRAAAAWARDVVRERVEVTAGRTSARAEEQRHLAARLAEDVLSLRALGDRERRFTASSDASRGAAIACPFKGLASFGPSDADFFAGREEVVAEMVASLAAAPVIAVAGASGCGKSSIVRAGLLPTLAAGVLPGSDTWRHVVVRPGEHPLRELHAALAGADHARRVVAVDQFEEAFTVCEDHDERAAFFDLLVDAADADMTAATVIAVRGDFYGEIATHQRLAALLAPHHVLVGAMTAAQLRRAIEQPAQRAGLELEPELVTTLVADVEGRPGALPLLSTALLELWRRRHGRNLRLADYEATGGVGAAVARLAESAYDAVPPAEQPQVRALLLRLTSGDGSHARRPVPLDELDPGSSQVLDTLVARRLLTVSDGAVELAHEALIAEWPRLRRWLDEDLEGRRIRAHLIAAAKEWERDRDAAELYRGARLVAALDWAEERRLELNRSEAEFLAESRAAAERETSRARRENRRLRTLLAVASVLLVLAAGATALAVLRGRTAAKETTLAEAQRLGAQALLEFDLVRSLLLARQAVALDDSPETRGNLLAALLRRPAAIGTIEPAGGRPQAIDLSGDGRRIVVGDAGGYVQIFDAHTLRALSAPVHVPGVVRGVAADAAGRRIAVSSDDGRAHVWMLDLAGRTDRREIARLPGARAGGVALSPDGTRVAAVWLADGAAFVGQWDRRSGRAQGAPVAAGGARTFPFVDYIQDARRLVLMDPRRVTVRDTADPRRIVTTRSLTVIGVSGAVSDDGRWAVSGGRAGGMEVIDLRTGASRRVVGASAPVLSMSFAADRRSFVAGAADGSVTVWDADKAAVKERFNGHAGAVIAVGLVPDAATAYSASLDGGVIAWDVRGRERLGRPFRAGSGFRGVPWFAASPDGRRLAVLQGRGPVSLVDAGALVPRATLPGSWEAVAFGPDGHTAVTAHDDGTLVLWDARGRPRRRAVIRTAPGPVLTPTFARGGRVLVAGGPASVQLWDVGTRRAIGPPWRFARRIAAVALDPDGRRLAVGLDGGMLEVWDVSRRVPLLRRRVDGANAGWVEFSPDGRRLVAGGADGVLTELDTKSWQPVATPVHAQPGALLSAVVSPDGGLVATSGSDGTARLWDADTLRPVGSPLPGVPNHPVAVAFAPRGDRLFAVQDTGDAVAWDVHASRWADEACRIAGRTLTRQEWQEFLPRRSYRPACRP